LLCTRQNATGTARLRWKRPAPQRVIRLRSGNRHVNRLSTPEAEHRGFHCCPRVLGKDASSVFVPGIEASKRIGEVIEASEPFRRDLDTGAKIARRAPIIPGHHLFHVKRGEIAQQAAPGTECRLDLMPDECRLHQQRVFWRFAAARSRRRRTATKYPAYRSISPSSVLNKSAAETGFDCSVGPYSVAQRYS